MENRLLDDRFIEREALRSIENFDSLPRVCPNCGALARKYVNFVTIDEDGTHTHSKQFHCHACGTIIEESKGVTVNG